jgi:anti-sigma B factor antagonist
MAGQRRLEVEQIGGVTVVRWDEFPHWPADGDELFKLAERGDRRKVLVNFGKVDALASIVLAKLMMLNKKLQASSGSLLVCGVSPRVREVFEITRLNEFFDFHPTEEDALQAFAAPVGEPEASV